MNYSRWTRIVHNMVATAQRRTPSRAAAHQLLCSGIESLGLGIDAETALRAAVYRYLFPEHADRLVREGGIGA